VNIIRKRHPTGHFFNPMSDNTTCELRVQPLPPPPTIQTGSTEIRVRGKAVRALSVTINNIPVVVAGRWLKLAAVQDERFVDRETFRDPELFIRGLKQSKTGADIFTFAQNVFDPSVKFPYHVEWDNAAAIPITSYQDWFEKRAATDVRQNVKKSAKRGVVVKSVPFDDEFVNGIVSIFNESPVRQGRRFWHYGKDFETVKKETSHSLEKSEFIGAYCQNELIGFIKLLCAGGIADIVLIVSKQQHHDKRPTNALIAKAVEVCAGKGISYLTYAKYAYGKKTDSSLAEFKRRNGFEEIRFPRYYVPLTLKGKLAVRFKLYDGIRELLPASALTTLVKLRSKLYQLRLPGKPWQGSGSLKG
jgi:hypothetical protein